MLGAITKHPPLPCYRMRSIGFLREAWHNNRMKQVKPELKKWIWIGLLVVLLVALFFGLRYMTYARPPLPEALVALQPDALVSVEYEPWLTFTPAQIEPDAGFIFYPGGRIEPRGYAPLLREIAEEGYLVITPEMPFNMAPFDANVADEIRAAHPEVQNWLIGGHSVGGTIAAQYLSKHPEQIDALVIWASYPADNVDLLELSQPMTLIYGTLDPRVNEASVSERIDLFPAQAEFVKIEGGDHHQFGSYVIKPEEHFAVISSEEQQEQIIEATLVLLEEINK